MGFYQDINVTYGYSTMRNLKDVANINIKLANLRNRRNFLLRCRKNNLVPPHITSGVHNVENLTNTATGSLLRRTLNFNRRLRNSILNLEIKITHETVLSFEKTLTSLKSKLVTILPTYIITEFYRKLSINYSRRFFKVKKQNQKKFQNLILTQSKKIISQPNWIKNLTDIEIPQDIKNFLALGPKFSIQPCLKDINVPHLLADIDYIVDKSKIQNKNLILSKSCNLVTNFLHNDNNFNNHLNVTFNRTKKFLKENPNIRVINSDKMNVTTIMTTSQYESLANDILKDSNYYKVLRRDSSNTIQQKANKFISNLVQNNILTENEGKTYRNYNGVINKFYGLPKIHKPILSLRPIISGVNSPNREVAQLITDILSIAYKNDNNFFVKDSFQFCNFINEFQLPPNHIIISLDAKALFNNISCTTAINSITKHWIDISKCCKLTLSQFIQAIEFLYDSTVFSFSNNIYKQIQGMPMGSPVSPILAQYVMDDLVEACMNKLSFQIPFLKKYVDDFILSIPHNGINEILQVFNHYDELVQFTIEEEDSNRSVPFLDSRLIRRENNSLITSWKNKK
ncbi:uncharacterized protein [Leptinotarsa decemlineata]|uniref:uncharacterized protein n=1 Tax=Leptinotarsa decemlineata TaxID=7539 RepID=UPI003D308B66